MKHWLVLILTVCLSGCARYKPQPLNPAQSEDAFRARSVTDAGLRAFVKNNFTNAPSPWPPKEFDLQSLTLVALYYHPDLELARARISEARADQLKAGERPNPTIGILPTGVANSFPGEPPWMMAVSFDVPIETAGKRGKRLEQARQAAIASRIALAETQWQVRARLRTALVDYFATQEDLRMYAEELEARSNVVEMLSKRLELGEASRFDVNAAQTDLLNSSLARNSIRTRIADARLAVASAAGLPAAALDQISVLWPDFGKPVNDFSPGALQTAGLLNRLDVRRSLAEYAAAEAALRLEVANQYPDLHLNPGYEFDQGEHKFSLGPSLTLPVLNQNRGAIAQAAAKRREAAAAFLGIQSEAIEETEKAAVDYRNALAEWSDAGKAATGLQRQVKEGIERALQLGETDRLTLLYARLQQFSADRARLDALRKVQEAVGALENAIQRPLFDDADWPVKDKP